MKYYVENAEDDMLGLMDLDEALEIYFTIQSGYRHGFFKKQPILKNENGEEIKNLFDEIPGRHDCFSEGDSYNRYIFEIEIKNVWTDSVKKMYRAIDWEFHDEATLYMTAIKSVDIPCEFRVVSVRTVGFAEG